MYINSDPFHVFLMTRMAYMTHSMFWVSGLVQSKNTSYTPQELSQKSHNINEYTLHITMNVVLVRHWSHN